MYKQAVPILVFLDLSVLDLGPTDATDRRQTKASLNAPAYYGRRHKKQTLNMSFTTVYAENSESQHYTAT